MREKQVEQALIKAVRLSGGMAVKFVSPGWDGAPDRIVLFPGEKIAFIEVKAPGKKMRPLQMKRKQQLEDMGFQVYCLDRIEDIDDTIERIKKGGDAA